MDQVQELEPGFDDLEINGETGNEPEAAIADGSRVIGKLIGWQVVPKPEYKIKKQKELNPDRDVDDQAWRITFEIQGGEYGGMLIDDLVNRAWGEKATASLYIAALLGKTKYDDGMRGNIRDLSGKLVSLYITAFKGRNYVDPKRCEPVQQRPAQRPVARPQQAGQPAVKQVTVNMGEYAGEPGAPLFDGDDDGSDVPF